MYTPPQDPNDPNDHGTFSHGYFTPSSHLAPCNFNADCNMSPIIPDFFVTTKSMQNAQALENTNGLAKYVCKYVAKFDDGNYIVLLQDVHTGQWILRKVKLHNTKIAGSKINEDKAFHKSRDKGHPRGREVTYFEIRQLMMGDPEVLTDLTFIPISTLPFELRPTNTIELDDEGNVISPNEDEIDGEDGNHNPDLFTEGIPMQRARMQFDLSEWHRMTEGQMLTYRNHNGKASKYDMISVFSLRPPELLGVFRNPIDYFRYCYIDEDDCYNEEDAGGVLCDDINECPWIDCLGRRVKIHALALDDVLDLVERNLEDYESIDQFDEANEFRILMNLAVKDMIRMYQASESGDQLSDEELEWVEDTICPNFIHFDETMRNLPIPVASDVRPDNAHQFLTHIILSLGKYDTEIDALSHPNTRDCLRAVGLIGNSSDADQLRQYSNNLTRLYIEEQLVYYAISLRVGETFIVTSKNVMDNAIVNDSLSMNELPPFTMATLRMSTTAQNKQWWADMTNLQLDSIYSTRSLQQTDGMPTREDINNVTRDTPLMWNPTDVMTRYERQSEASFAEQKYAIGLEVDQINRYRNANQEGNFTCLKNTVIYGAPGTGKSFVSQSLVLYAISQGLNVISTALMGVRANALGGGGLHLHQLFKLPTDDNGIKLSPFKAAQAALGKIYRQIDLLHALLTVDVIFVDECSQVSSETLVMIDIILRKLRGNSQTPFGGVHIIGTMDNSQLQPIEELPFLVSSFMLTCFVMVKLEHSVRAYGDVRFQRLQAISRMDPFELRASQELKDEFFTLAHDILTFVPDWDDPRIGPNMMRAFSRKNPAKRTLDNFREQIKSQLTAEGVEFRAVTARDTQKRKGTNGDYVPASEQCIKQLDREMKEPRELVLFPGGVYECTINDRHKGFSQSQLALLIDLPSEEDVNSKHEIKMWIAPPATGQISFDRRQLPSRAYLESLGWKEVFVGCTPERDVNVRGGLVGRRFQYSLKHIGATTINKSQGATLPYGIAVEISEDYSPWESGQIVVAISRTESSAYTIIVGEENFAIAKMWELITTGNQWSRYTKHILENITANPNAERTIHRNVIYHNDAYPFRRIDTTIPLDSTGFVYCLTSTRNPHKIYIGQTKNLSQRLVMHNRGEGAEGTRDPRDRPWAIGSYICGLGHMNQADRENLEQSWKDLVSAMQQHGIDSSYNWIMAGRRIIQRYNEDCVDDAQNIRFVSHVVTGTGD